MPACLHHTMASIASSRGCASISASIMHRSCKAAASQAVERTQSLGEICRKDFPILHQTIDMHPLIYLDSAATSQKPTAVLDAMQRYYNLDNSNVHRGVHTLAGRATDAYEAARQKVATFVNAKSDREIVWTRNATEAVNLVAYSWAMHNLKKGDEVILSVAEHHANLVPWQMVAKATGAVLKHVTLTRTQEIDMDDLRTKVTPRTKLISMVHVSNMLGCILPVDQVVEAAHSVGAKVLLDCCQSVPHSVIDVQAMGADWIVASGHKMCGPTGAGFLWGKGEVLEEMHPWMGGGEMIDNVSLESSTYAPPPLRFEAGTPAIGECIGLGAAVDYLTGIGMDRIHAHENEVGGYLYQQLSAIDGVTIYGPEQNRGRAALAAFNVEGLHATDVSMLLNAGGVAVRSGHHCTQPVHKELGIAASARASCYLYTTEREVDVFVETLKDSVSFFRSMNM